MRHRAADPRPQGVVVAAQPFRIRHRGGDAGDHDAPSGAPYGVERVGLVGDHRALAGRTEQGRAAVGADDHLVAVEQMVDRPDRRQRPVAEDHPPHRHTRQQVQRLLA
ncbi:hypothetical protein SCATT_p03420 (plasmid) [Streptantibioticus cattleyicolor NRRL 8057 = DSM 46488]|uniref:Uncharacterized protein n=1 Tax=Streptantibioticus cattleyicolor (strain ATCC 35852 / DSM 46488 / JCM 4925 / NBRC 14057 / NRRL 8057) TaxID=1003195 RepID=G8XFG5_STREN|nr:hypothetical protein SCATT_p03420 [Streptantibioticus cattleyicolor NRRL 8057 = DSM 46488]